MSVNKAIILGHLGRDPELRTGVSGDPFCTFSLATTRHWKGADGEKRERTDWHDVVVSGRQATHCAKYLHKGRQVYVEGSITHSKRGEPGRERYYTNIRAREVRFLAGRRTEAPPATPDAAAATGTDSDVAF
jgi:single-strand DNA-binding protein